MRHSTCGLLLGFAVAAAGPALAQQAAPPGATPASAAAPAPTAAQAAATTPAVAYEVALNCAANYDLYAGEAELAGRKDAKKARFASSDKAAAKAEEVGVKAGKTAGAVKDELAARMQAWLDKPPPTAVIRATAQRCDGSLGLTTP